MRRSNHKHHILPRSRDGKNGGNLKIVPKEFYYSYHHLFINMTPEEILEYLKEIWFTNLPFIYPEQWLKERRGLWK
jgi:hypothetical protein